LLASRAHSARELRTKLLRRGHRADEVSQALERLSRDGYLDDAAYAEALVVRRSGSRGARAIAAELAAKGIGREAAQAALSRLQPGDELRAATQVARRLGRLDPDRAGARLVRRGFSFQVARAALRPGVVDVLRDA